MKIKLKTKNSKILILSSIFFAGFCINASALDTSIYRFPDQQDGFYDTDVPSALIVNTAGDGLERGTILYRHIHEDIDYYSPIVPQHLKGTDWDKNGTKAQDWGPWKMEVNKKPYTIHTRTTYTSAVTTKTVTVNTNTSATSNAHKEIGTLPSGTRLNVLSKRNSNNLLFFDLSPFPTLLSKSTTGVGMIRLDNGGVSLSGEKTVVYDKWKDNVYLQNFKKMGRYDVTLGSGLQGIENGRYVNPVNAPSELAGKFGEWRYLGYNAKGQPLNNPYFPADDLHYTGNSYLWGYPWRLTPWDKTDAESGESDPNEAYKEFASGKTAFPYDNGSYDSYKKEAVRKLHSIGQLKPSNPTESELMYMVKRLSLETHPVKQSIILNGQHKRTIHNKTTFLPNHNLRDLYLHSIVITDDDTNATVATYNGTLAGKAPYTTGTVEKGKTYTAKVYLANGANSDMLVTSLQSQIGFIYNARAVNMNMPYGSTYNKQTQIRGNKGGIRGTQGSKSQSFDFRFSVDETQTGHIDLYAFVGMAHQGVDNLDYDNDIGVIRLYVDTNPPPTNSSCTITNGGKTKICGGGDIRPHNIKLFDESGVEVYRHFFNESSPVIKRAIIPGKKYKLVYSAIYKGEDVLEYQWIEGRDDDPNTPADEYVPGKWGEGKYKEYTIPLNYIIEKYSGGPRELDSIVRNLGGNFYVHGDTSDTTVPMYDGVLMGYQGEFIMYQYPYLKTAFRPVVNDSRINSDTSNDRMEVILNDNFDISIKNLKVTPTITYIEGGSKKINYNVSYDAELTTPSYVTAQDYQASINTAIKINGNTYYVKDQLVKGTSGNKNITHIIEGVTVPASGQVTVNVNLNYDKQSYETGNYSNNVGSTNVNIVKVKDPGLGSPNDTVKTPDSLNSNNSNKGGDANNNCLTPRTKNTWTSTHRRFSWNSNVISYNKISSGANVKFNKYYTTYENLNEATETYTEEFGIQKILFRSKETREKKYGNDGWINLLDSAEAGLAEIKAGYGFELQIVTKYSTDALTKRTWTLSNDGASGTSVSALNGKPNYGLEDVFLELPGTSTTRKILSSTGYGSTTLGLISSKKVTGDTVEWTYTIKPANTVGIGETAKIYIPSETKDGDYTLKIYTPPVPGATSLNKKTYSALCDRKEVVIKVKGSAMNDLNSHETQ